MYCTLDYERCQNLILYPPQVQQMLLSLQSPADACYLSCRLSRMQSASSDSSLLTSPGT